MPLALLSVLQLQLLLPMPCLRTSEDGVVTQRRPPPSSFLVGACVAECFSYMTLQSQSQSQDSVDDSYTLHRRRRHVFPLFSHLAFCVG